MLFFSNIYKKTERVTTPLGTNQKTHNVAQNGHEIFLFKAKLLWYLEFNFISISN